MSKLFWKSLTVAPILVAVSLLNANGAVAQSISDTNSKNSVDETLQQINSYDEQNRGGSMSQVTNVNQLRDVSPTDWAYEALRSLVDRYGCIAGFPNQTYRGNQPLSRYEFAAGLNSCLNQIERLIASSEAVVREDLDTINRLSQEFEAELATINGRIDNIESRTAFLEDNQFSTTAKLKGEVIFAIADAFGGGLDLDENDPQVIDFDGDGDIDEEDVDEAEDLTELDSETTFSNRVRLNFDASFYGEDRLRVRLESGNVTDFGLETTGTDSGRLGFDADTENSIEIGDLTYRFPVTDRATVHVGAVGMDLDDIFSVTNPMLEDSGTGALSRFNRRNPVVLRGTEGAGAGVNFEILEDKLTVSALYLADTEDASSPEEEQGLFNGSNSVGAQVEISPIENLELAATYVRSYEVGGGNFSGSTVSGFASDPFGDDDTVANRIGLGANYTFRDRFVIAGWGGYADVEGLQSNLEGEVWTWSANVSVLDLLKEGSVLSVAGGMVPKFISDDAVNENQVGLQEDRDTSYLIEALYKFPVNDNILLTPGAYVVLNPNHNEDNDAVWVGVLRTTFQF